MKDSELKRDKVYWAEIIDKELDDLCGKQIKVKFTGILFRNIEYIKKEIGDFVNDPKEAVRRTVVQRSLSGKKDAVLYLAQLKIFKEVDYKELPNES